MLNLRQLEIFRELMRSRTMGDVADSFAITQPAVSIALKQMETQLGFRLFDRVAGKLKPTGEALDMLEATEPLVEAFGAFGRGVKRLRQATQDSLRIAATPPTANAIVPRALKAFRARHPDIQLYLDVARSASVVDDVKMGFADLGIVLEPPSRAGVSAELICSGQMMCVMPFDHPLADLIEISARDLRQHTVIGFSPSTRLEGLLQREFWRDEPRGASAVEVSYGETACQLAESDLGVALVDVFTGLFGNRYKLTARPLSPRVSVDAYAIFAEPTKDTSKIRGFVSELHKAVESVLSDLGLEPAQGSEE